MKAVITVTGKDSMGIIAGNEEAACDSFPEHLSVSAKS